MKIKIYLGEKVEKEVEREGNEPLVRFQKWGNVVYKGKAKMREYKDGEPYFNFAGAEISFSKWYFNYDGRTI